MKLQGCAGWVRRLELQVHGIRQLPKRATSLSLLCGSRQSPMRKTMRPQPLSKNTLYIGWDVGGWNCERNANSRDALVVLDADRKLLGAPWRGNLRQAINECKTTADWISALLTYCQVDWPREHTPAIVLAIDTPLGFPVALRKLLSGERHSASIDDSANNPYLYRHTERYLFKHGLAPLSAIKDMIGSQATKGIHALAKFAPINDAVGLWRDEHLIKAFEAYPAACKQSLTMASLLLPFMETSQATSSQACIKWQGKLLSNFLDHEDKRDALVCALLAWLYDNDNAKLQPPDASATFAEGWIFAPKDALAGLS